MFIAYILMEENKEITILGSMSLKCTKTILGNVQQCSEHKLALQSLVVCSENCSKCYTVILPCVSVFISFSISRGFEHAFNV